MNNSGFSGVVHRLRELIAGLSPVRNSRRQHRHVTTESLEQRIVLSNYEVLNTFNSGPGSLRQAIIDANGHAGKDRIVFNFLSGFQNRYEVPATQTLDMRAFGDTSVLFPQKVAVIRPSTSLPIITDPVVIDAQTERAFTQQLVPSVEIRGDLTSTTSGLRIQADNSEIRGLIVNSFEHGIQILAGSNNRIENNYIGVHWADGTQGNKAGIKVRTAGNYVRNNLMNDNVSFAIQLANANNSTVQGNTIRGGKELISVGGSSNCLIGGTTSGLGNTLAGGSIAINIASNTTAQSNSNTVLSNNIHGGYAGIWLHGAANNIVGGTTLNSANVVAGAFEGIVVSAPLTTNNTIRSNYIGVARGGKVTGELWGNDVTGVHVYDAPANIIRDNIIGGLNSVGSIHGAGGVVPASLRDSFAAVAIDGRSAVGNQLSYNKIGIGADGVTPLINYGYGVYLLDQAKNTRLEGNVISNSVQSTIPLAAPAAGVVIGGGPGTVLVKNYIGTTAAGTASAGNDNVGVQILTDHVTLGGPTAASRNYISGNRGTGVFIGGPRAHDITIQGNYIGVDKTGDRKLANDGDGIFISEAGLNIEIGGPDIMGNTISGNKTIGLGISKTNAVLVQGNRIGTNAFGDTAIGNGKQGIVVHKSNKTLIGGSDPLAVNVVSGNGLAGILILGDSGTDAKQNFVYNNIVGASILSQPLGNGGAGIALINAAINVIGESAENIIAYNAGPGVYLGEIGATKNRVKSNLIQGNEGAGLQTRDSSSNTIAGNSIQDNLDGGVFLAGGKLNSLYGNSIRKNGAVGIGLYSTTQNQIGVETAATNLISGHDLFGVYVRNSNSNTITKNRIYFSNVAGIGISEGNSNVVTTNVITDNLRGILVESGIGNSFISNQIYDNRSIAIDLLPSGVTANDAADVDSGPNGLQNSPVLTQADAVGNQTHIVGRLESAPNKEYRIQFFKTESRHPFGLSQAQTLVGDITVTTNAEGVAVFDQMLSSLAEPGNVFSAIATGTEGSSEVSAPYSIPSPEFFIGSGPHSPAIAVDHVGNSIVAAIDFENYSILFTRFDAQGLPRDPFSVKVNTVDGEFPHDVAVGMDGTGNFVVAWVDTLAGGSHRVYARRFLADGSAIDEDQFTVDSPPDFYPNSSFVTKYNVSVAMNRDGAFVIAFEGGDLFQNPALDVYVRPYAADGTPLASNEFKVNQQTTGDQTSPEVAIDENGNFIVVWLDGGVIMQRRFSSTGTPLENQRAVFANGGGFNPGGYPDIAMNAAGDYVIVWNNGAYTSPSTGRFQRFSRTGVALDPAPVIFANNTVLESPEVSMDAAGNFAITWTGTDEDIHLARFRSSGQPLAPTETANGITAGRQQNPQIAMTPSGNFSICFVGPNGMFVRGFDYRPDIQMRSVTASGESQIELEYEISGVVDAFSIDVLQSADEVPGVGDTLLATIAITSPSELTPGVHRLVRDVGGQAGSIPIPGMGLAAANFSHSLLFVADRANLIGERDINTLLEDNTATLSGVLSNGSGTILVYGTGLSDDISITEGSVHVHLNSFDFEFESSAVSSVRVYAGGGDDTVRMLVSDLPLLAWGGAGDDSLFGGNADDNLSGNAGDDQLYGGGGTNTIVDNQGTNITALSNIAPVLSVVLSAATFDGTSPEPTLIAPTILVTDADTLFLARSIATITSSDARPYDTISILQSPTADGVKLQGTNIRFGAGQEIVGTWKLGSDGVSATIRFSSSATPSIVQAVLRRIAFTASVSNSAETERHFRLTLTDGQHGVSEPLTLVVSVTNTNDPPQLLIPSTVTYTENEPALVLSPDAIVIDPDSPTFEGGYLIVTNAVNWTTADSLQIRTAGGVAVLGTDVMYTGLRVGTVSGGNAQVSLAVNFNQNATIEAVQAIARNIVFVAGGENPSIAPRTLEWSLLDGDGGEMIHSQQTVNIVALNDAPTVTGFGGFVNYTENTAPILIAPLAGVRDVDSANFNTGKLIISLTVHKQATDILSIMTSDSLTISSGNEIRIGGNLVGTFTGGLNNMPLEISLTPAATPVLVQKLLRSITFHSNSENPSTLPRVVNVTLADGTGGISTAARRTIRVTAVNDKPVINAFAGSSRYSVSSRKPIRIDADATVTDVDGANLQGGVLRIAIKANIESTDVLGFVTGGLITISNVNEILVGGFLIGKYSGGNNNASLAITFTTANATPARVQTLLRAITFHSSSATPSKKTRSVEVTLSDSSGATSIAVRKLIEIS